MSNILVTGANGFIGRALVEKLNSHGLNVVSLTSMEGDIANKQTMEKFSQKGISHVFHLAGKTFVPDSWINPQIFYETNVLGTVNVLEFCRVNHVPLTYISAYVYGHPDILPIREDSVIRPSNPYAMTKWIAEQTCAFYAKTYDFPVITIRAFNAYGIGQAENFLIPAIISQVLDGGANIIVKDLMPKRDYVYLDDLLTALIATLSNPINYRVYNIGSGVSLSVKEVIDIIQEVAGTKKNVICNNVARANELMDVVADITNVKNEFGWYPKHSFRAGIEEIIKSELRGKKI